MPTIKTAISVDKSLFSDVDELAREMNVSRSQLVSTALEQFLKQRKSQRVLQELNQVYAEPDKEGEKELRKRARPQHRRLVEGEW